MKQWFYRLNPREQLSVLVMLVAVLLYLVYIALWSPLAERRDTMASRNTATQESLQRVDAMVSEILRLRDSDNRSSNSGNLTGLINQTTASNQLSVSRLQPNSRGEVQVRLEAVSFVSLMTWLDQLESGEGLSVLEIAITQAGASGQVNATVRFASPG